MMQLGLTFFPQRESPKEEGDYVIYNQCDGFHIVQARVEDGEFLGFQFWAQPEFITDDSYQAWAKLPGTDALYEAFADKPVNGRSARDVTMERLARQAR